MLGNTENDDNVYLYLGNRYCRLCFCNTSKDQRMGILCASVKLKANKAGSILVEFHPCLRWRLTSLDDRQDWAPWLPWKLQLLTFGCRNARAPISTE